MTLKTFTKGDAVWVIHHDTVWEARYDRLWDLGHGIGLHIVLFVHNPFYGRGECQVPDSKIFDTELAAHEKNIEVLRANLDSAVRALKDCWERMEASEAEEV